MLRNLAVAAAFATLLAMSSASAQNTPEQAPSPSLVKDERVYELRIYHAFPGKLEEVHKRFRDHTLKIFAKHGMKVVAFWGPTDVDKGANKDLIYVLEFPSREAATKAWNDFRNDPEWQKVQKASEANGKLVEKVDSIFMKATDYAPKMK
jgi:uncharacterized protein (DUF1330 family)